MILLFPFSHFFDVQYFSVIVVILMQVWPFSVSGFPFIEL
jgi:hypothetical protein